MVVEHHDEVGFRIWAPRYGRHVVRRDGTHVRCVLPRVAAWRWERLDRVADLVVPFRREVYKAVAAAFAEFATAPA